MAPRYLLANDLGESGKIDYAPRWVVGVVRFANQNTFNLSTGLSLQRSDEYAMEERRPTLVMSSQVVSVNTSSAKASHVTNLNAVLMGAENFLSVIMPGDWVACCMLYSDNEAQRVAEAMGAGKAVNAWNDGLKFLGRVAGLRKGVSASPDGQRMTRYTLSACGFGEFDYALYYHPALEQVNRVPVAMHNFGLALQSIVRQEGFEKGTIDINLALPKLIRAVFGVGAYANAPGVGNLQGGTGSANRPMLIPATVAGWLGVGADNYADILRPIIGVQHYRTNADVSSASQAAWPLFKPDNIEAKEGFFKVPSELTGSFPPAPPPSETTVWGLLSGYSNMPINEMYVTLRTDPIDGRIMPHFIARQNPYTTDGAVLADVLKRDAVEQVTQATPRSTNTQETTPPVRAQDFTSFQELPRWVVDETMLYSMDIGRSDGLRANYVFIAGVGAGSGTSIEGSFVRAPPNMDELDIKRNGLRPYMTSVNCFFQDARLGPTAWRDVMTDVMVNQNLTLSGQFNLVGIRAPIAVGDNLEFENVVYHIEQVNHAASISPTGQRQWLTTLNVSHGILLETESKFVGDERGGLFAGAHGEQDFAANLPLTEDNDD